MKTRFRHLVPLSLAALLFLPELTSAQVVKRQPDVPLVRAASAGCGATNEGFLKILVDASSPVDCDTTPEATIGDWVKALCICRDGALESVYEGSFALLNGDDDGQDIQGVSGSSQAFLSLIETGALLYGPGASPASIAVAETAVEIYSPNANGALTIDDTTSALKGATTTTVNGGGGATELTVTAGKTAITGALQLNCVSAPPVSCAVGTVGVEYCDSDIAKKCFCNGTNYVLETDFTTTTGCS